MSDERVGLVGGDFLKWGQQVPDIGAGNVRARGNPASCPTNNLSLVYNSSYEGISQGAVSANFALGAGFNAGLTVESTSYGEFEKRDINDSPVDGGKFSAGSTVITFEAGKQLAGGALGVGAAVKYFDESIADWRRTGLDLDIGAAWRPEPFALELKISDLGSKNMYAAANQNSSDELPLRAGGEIAYENSFVAGGFLPEKISAGGEYSLNEKTTYWHAGAQWSKGFSVSGKEMSITGRVGYNNITGPTFGLGLGLPELNIFGAEEKFSFDYAVVPDADLGQTTHKISLTLAWGSK